MPTIKKLLITAFLFNLLSFQSFAAEEIRFLPPAAVAKNQQTITRIQDYLTHLTTIISDFTQTAPDGSLTSGKFFLERPGKMRWQYNPPTPILMVSNGSEMVYYDYELEQASHLPLDQTLIGFLAEPVITFDGKIGITEFSSDAGAIRITLVQRDKSDEGSLMLEFSDHPLLLRNMVVRDAGKQVTTVSLNNARFGIKMDPELFIFREPGKRRKIH